jgi:hypothetical protein
MKFIIFNSKYRFVGIPYFGIRSPKNIKGLKSTPLLLKPSIFIGISYEIIIEILASFNK